MNGEMLISYGFFLHIFTCTITPEPETDIYLPRPKIELETAGFQNACANLHATAIFTYEGIELNVRIL